MDIDNELKQTLEQLLKLCRDFSIQPRLIGGLAVRGFARRKRYTHDIDLASSRFEKSNLVTILKQMGFDYQDQSQFEGVKASKRIGNKTVEIHIAIDRLWDMVSNRTYTPSTECAEVPIDEAGDLLAPAVSAEDLLILKLLPLRDRDLCDIIALLLDLPGIDASTFWANCERTDNTNHIAAQLRKLENALKSGSFREAWAEYYGEPLPKRDILYAIDKLREILRTKP